MMGAWSFGSNDVVTAGAALAHFDLALWLVRRISPALAAVTARYLMIDPRSSAGGLCHTGPPDPHRCSSRALRALDARELFQRIFPGRCVTRDRHHPAHLGATTARRAGQVAAILLFQDLRVERAVHLLQTSGESVERIAIEVGYSDAVTLRNLLRRRLGRSASQLRRLEG